jgi:hypothetical protein
MTVYKALHGQAPAYITEMFNYVTPHSKRLTLRSAAGLAYELKMPGRRVLTAYGDRALCVAGPGLWNSLPLHVRMAESLEVFRRRLKTYLFVQSYGSDQTST